MPGLLTEIRGHIAYLTMNRPHVHNALSPELMVRLARTWHELLIDDRVRVVILTGAGNQAFCAGADLGRLIPLLSGARAPEDEWDREILDRPDVIEHATLKKIDFFKPVIAAVNGFCVAGGMELMLASDIGVAVDTASFGLQEVKWGIAPLGGGVSRLPRQMPWCKAMEVLLTGNRFDAQEAWRLGLVNYVVGHEQLMARAEQLAETIAENGPLAVRIVKQGRYDARVSRWRRASQLSWSCAPSWRVRRMRARGRWRLWRSASQCSRGDRLGERIREEKGMGCLKCISHPDPSPLPRKIVGEGTRGDCGKGRRGHLPS